MALGGNLEMLKCTECSVTICIAPNLKHLLHRQVKNSLVASNVLLVCRTGHALQRKGLLHLKIRCIVHNWYAKLQQFLGMLGGGIIQMNLGLRHLRQACHKLLHEDRELLAILILVCDPLEVLLRHRPAPVWRQERHRPAPGGPAQ